jgi:ATP-binding cassette subfamily C protein/ATP-binding cassette subfamily C protein LapB
MLVYNQISIQGVETNLWLLFFGIGLIVLLQSLCSVLRTYMFNYLGARTSYLVSNELTRRSLYLPLIISDQSSVGDHISRFKSFQRVREFFSQNMLVTLMDVPYTLMTVVAIYLLAGEVAYIPVVAIVIFFLFSYYFSPILSKMGEHSIKLSKLKNQFIFESIMGLRNFTTPKIKQRLRDRFEKINQETIKSKLAIKRKDQLLNIISTALISITAFATIGMTVTFVIEGKAQAGALMAVILLIWKTLAPIRSFFTLIGQFHFYNSTVRSIDRFMEIGLEERPEDYFKEEKEIRGTIELKGVSIRFVKESFPSLINIDLKIPSNNTILMLGKNGSGKSTILKLIIALYEPQGGRIAIDGVNIKQLNPFS